MSEVPAPIRSVPVGHVFSSRPRRLSLPRILAFSGGPLADPGWPQKNLHTDIGKARDAGLSSIIASGTQSEGILISLLVDVCGTSWHRAGTLSVRFVKSVRVDETITAFARLTAREGEGAAQRLTFDVWCENIAAEAVITGTAAFGMPNKQQEGSHLDASSA